MADIAVQRGGFWSTALALLGMGCGTWEVKNTASLHHVSNEQSLSEIV